MHKDPVIMQTLTKKQSNGRSPFDNNLKRTTNSSVTRANMIEPSTHRTNWRYHCSVTCVK